MITNKEKNISNTSYTSKDFNSIYSELLDLVKELTYRWDPSISNESDPGVILLKLNALIADKCNYNIDKNILEAFPLSVTQEKNARQLYEQLGYYMHWYKGATTNVYTKWIGETSTDDSYTIPAFTMVSDANNETIYTLVGPAENTTVNTFNVGSQKLPCDGTILTWKAIQGVATIYDINGETLITTDLLDSNNRIYFTSKDIAENGIFICNAGLNNYSVWQKKDNLVVENLGNTYYKFGISQDTGTCYIEFPEDADTIFMGGINIIYIRTMGSTGNISAQTLEKFYTNISPEEDSNIVLTADNVKISNVSSAINGEDKETIDDSYLNYKRVVGTFDTLVTLRDYMNAIITSNLVSNCFVCDRNTDIQSSYKIITMENDVNQLVNVVSTDTTILSEDKIILDKYNLTVDEMSAFSLKLYLLQHVSDTSTIEGFNKSFDMLLPNDTIVVKEYIKDLKSINHDFVDILPINNKLAHFCYFINKYPISCKIIPQYSLTVTQSSDVVDNIRKALFASLNGKELSFGESVSLDDLLTIIKKSDERIKNVLLDNITYSTYAVYYDDVEKSYKEIEISSTDEEPVSINVIQEQVDPENILNVEALKYTKVPFGTPYYASNKLNDYSFVGNTTSDILVDNIYDTYATIKIDDITYFVKQKDIHAGYYFIDYILSNDIIDYSTYTFIYNGTNWTLNDNIVTLEDYGIKIISETGTPQENDKIEVRISIKTQLQNEIYAKSVLAGTTQLFVNDENFDYKINQLSIKTYTNPYITDPPTLSSVTQTGILIDNVVSLKGATQVVLEKNKKKVIESNETVQLIAPNLLDLTSYSNYVRFEYLGQIVQKDSSYQLSDNEWLILYWKASDDDVIFNYAVYGAGNFICPTFTLNSTGEQLVGASLLEKVENIDGRLVATTERNGMMSSELSSQIEQLSDSKYILSGSKKITIKTKNEITLNNSSNIYWITNQIVDDQYILFDDDKTTKILSSGEYFIYSDNTLTNLNILGAGTSITKKDTDTNNYAVDMIDASTILSDGIDALVDHWYRQDENMSFELTITENQFINIPQNSTVLLEEKIVGSPNIVILDSDNQTDLSNYNIYYQLPGTTKLVKVNDVASSTGGWSGKAILNINISKSEPQVLYFNQSITYKTLSGEEETIYGSDVITPRDAIEDQTYELNPITIYSTNTLFNSTGTTFSTLSQDIYNNVHFTSLYLVSQTTKITKDDGSILFNYNSDGDLIIRIKQPSEEITKFSILSGLPVGNWIIPIKLSQDVEHLNVYSKSNNYWKEVYSSIDDINTAGTHYLSADFNDANTLEYDDKYSFVKLTFELVTQESDVVITVGNPYKYTQPKGMSNEQFISIIRELQQLDVDRLYDYTYVVDPKNNISNPLDSNSFNQSQHIYNPFTICKLDTSENTTVLILNN